MCEINFSLEFCELVVTINVLLSNLFKLHNDQHIYFICNYYMPRGNTYLFFVLWSFWTIKALVGVIDVHLQDNHLLMA